MKAARRNFEYAIWTDVTSVNMSFYPHTSQAGKASIVSLASVCVCDVCLSAIKYPENYWSEIGVTWQEYVIRRTLEVNGFWWHMTLTFDLESCSVFLDKIITYNLKTVGHIFMHFTPWPLTAWARMYDIAQGLCFLGLNLIHFVFFTTKTTSISCALNNV